MTGYLYCIKNGAQAHPMMLCTFLVPLNAYPICSKLKFDENCCQNSFTSQKN